MPDTMDTITISAEWWCPQKRVHQTRKDLAQEISKIAASHINYDVTDYGQDGCLVRAELRVCVEVLDGEKD